MAGFDAPNAAQPVVDPSSGVATNSWYQFFQRIKAVPSPGPSPGTGSLVLNVTPVTNAMSPYTIQPSDCVLSCDSTGGPITINPPTSINDGLSGQTKAYLVKDRTGNAGISNVLFGFTIDGSSARALSSPYDARWIASLDGTTWSFLT